MNAKRITALALALVMTLLCRLRQQNRCER